VECTSPHKAMAQSSYTFEDLSGSVMSSSSNPYDGLLEACHHDPVGRQPFAEAFTNRIARRRSRLGIRFTEKRENRNRKQSCCLRSSQASQRIRFCTDSKLSQVLLIQGIVLSIGPVHHKVSKISWLSCSRG